MTVRLPPIGLALPPAWGEGSDQEWSVLREESARLDRDVLVDADVMDAVERLRVLLLTGATVDVIEAIRSRAGAGALAWLWCETDGSCRDTISVELLEALRTHHPRSTRLILDRLELVYFDRFDRLDDLNRDVDETSSGIRAALSSVLQPGWIAASRYDDAKVQILVDDAAPQLVADQITTHGQTLIEGLKNWNLGAHKGRFAQLVQQFVFLDRLRSIPVGANDAALEELLQPEVHSAPHVRGQLLGHAALDILIDRGETFPGDIWRDLVLQIAGDPRLNYTDTYRRWWPALGAQAEARVISWLAIADLSAFLELLTAFAADDPAMKRMLPARRKLLEGLVNEGIVRRSRLFLGEDVRRYVHRLGSQRPRWDFANLQQPREKALLYIDCGEFHLIEGSHNTKLWVYLSRPGEGVVNPHRRVFDYKEITSDLAEAYEDRRRRELGSAYVGSAHRSIAHQGMWQRPLLEFLAANGVSLNPDAILEVDERRVYRHRYAPSVGR